ncbi:polyamine ABC transporter substrate-binding protein [Halioxenophilus aromaticivorans]|uniref:Putrescine-binding periplasmic protein n=1 Tax=Halioxenophilus aromaticivorans TaxID=1306992 RepID=A0AAV3U088_9ALTE
MTLNRCSILALAVAGVALTGCSESEPEAVVQEAVVETVQKVNVYNWSDYIGEEVIAKFEEGTGIDVSYDVFDSNEVLESKLLAGRSGYDVVVPTSDFMARQIEAGVFLPLDKSKLTNYDKLDPEMMATLADLDPGNTYGVPYMWGTTGIGFIESKVKEVLGEDAPLDSWDLVFKPENLEKLKECGVSFLDAPTEIFSAALHYLGKDPHSFDPADYQGEAKEMLKALAPSVTYFHSSKYIDDLAAGEICVSIGWSGDIAQAMVDAEEAENGIEVSYIIPKEGALIWVDMLTIPKDASNPDEAHAFIDFLMQPAIAAENTNYIWYPNPIPASKVMIDQEITSDESIYPPEDVMAKLYPAKVLPPEIDRALNRAWTEIKTGQ